jgi:hypothetical protein
LIADQVKVSSWKVLKLHKDLFAPSLPRRHTMGLSMFQTGGCCRPFTLIPRQAAIDVLPKKGVQQLYNSLHHILSSQRALSRGHSKTIFGDRNKRIMCKSLGVRPERTARGVLDFDAWAKNIPNIHWRNIMRMVRRAELLFESFAADEVIQHIRAAKDAVRFKTMHAPVNGSSTSIPPAKYFGAIAFGCNVFLRCHRDEDFTLSMCHILLDGEDCYKLDDEIVVYFCFPTLGVAIPMRPGDFLLFNSTIPHCISSRCNEANNIISVTMYLKTMVVGGNDNSIELNDSQQMLSSKYRDMICLKPS